MWYNVQEIKLIMEFGDKTWCFSAEFEKSIIKTLYQWKSLNLIIAEEKNDMKFILENIKNVGFWQKLAKCVNRCEYVDLLILELDNECKKYYFDTIKQLPVTSC